MGNGPADDARGCFDLDPPSLLGVRAFVREIFDLYQLAVVPRLPIALARVVQDVDDLAALHAGVRVIQFCDYAERGAVNFAGQCLDLLTFVNAGNDFLAVGPVYQSNPLTRSPVAIGAAFKRARALVDVRARWYRVNRETALGSSRGRYHHYGYRHYGYRHYGYRHYRPYYRSYGYAPRPYYGGGYGGPYYGGGYGYGGPGISFSFGSGGYRGW